MTERVGADVAIVGAGPVGLVLAGLLGRRGVDVTVVDRALDVFPLPRAAHLDHTVLRVLQELGCVESLLPTMTPNTALVLADQALSPLVRIPAGGVGRSGFPASMYFYQPEFDRALESVAAGLPSVTILRGHDAISYDMSDHTATIHCRRIADDSAVDVAAKWVIACDGASSQLRESWGEDLESLDFDEQWLVLDLRIEDDSPRLPDHALQVCDPRRAWVSNPVPGGRYRVEMRLRDDDDPGHVMSLEHVSEFLRPLLGESRFEVERDAIYTFHGLVAPSWRKGRMLLAGDAAHQMPPFLGQGMVSGVRDAHNLAWKLAGVVQGHFSEEILDSYEQERKPHVESVVRSAIGVGRFVSQTDPVAVEARNRALRNGDVTDVPTFRIPDLAPGILVGTGGGSTLPQPVRGDTLPTLDGLLGDGFSVISISPIPSADRLWWPTDVPVRFFETRELGDTGDQLAEWLEQKKAQVVLVRPDRYILSTGLSLEAIRQDIEYTALALFTRDLPSMTAAAANEVS